MQLAPNRVAVYLTAGAGLAAAIAVPIANLDGSGTAGVVGGLAAVLLAFQQWMRGWHTYEAQLDDEVDPEILTLPLDTPAVDAVDLPDGAPGTSK